MEDASRDSSREDLQMAFCRVIGLALGFFSVCWWVSKQLARLHCPLTHRDQAKAASSCRLFSSACLVAATILGLGCEVLGTGTSFALGWCSLGWLGRKRCKIPFCHCYNIAKLGLVRAGLRIGTHFQLRTRFGFQKLSQNSWENPRLVVSTSALGA